MVFTGQKHLAFLRRNEGHRRRIEAGEEGGRRALCQLDPMDYLFNVFTERVENQRTSASKGEREKKYKTNKSCENLWSKCWC